MPGDSPLGVDRDLYTAIGSARREAALACRAGVRVRVMVERENGKFVEEWVAEPPP